jgi:hypothetical protein
VIVDLESCFRGFRRSALRVETLPEYAVGGQEEERLAAWLDGNAVPERSLHNNAFLQRIARDTLATPGRTWERLRIVDHPRTRYLDFELDTYPGSAAVGETIGIAVRKGGTAAAQDALEFTGQDFWLFDEGRDGAFAALMHYDTGGFYTGATLVDDEAGLDGCRFIAALIRPHAVPLSAYLADMRRRGRAAA